MQPHPSFPPQPGKMPAMGQNMVATSHPLAVQAGLGVLRDGGNAVDAAVAAAITLTVVEPTMNGIGSDAFCIVSDGGALHGLNASGKSPAALSPKDFDGMDSMPSRGWPAVTVPGAVSAWVALAAKFGRLPFARLFEDAIHYAAHGFMVTPVTARLWAMAPTEFRDFPDFGVFLPAGRAPGAGELFRFPDQARTLEQIAQTNGEAFYRGALARQIAAMAARDGGKLTLADLETHEARWVKPLAFQYNDLTLHELPPNGQGIGAQLALGILQHTALKDYDPDSVASIHCQLEAMKLAFADSFRYVSDPDCMELDPASLLDPDYLAARAALIDMNKAGKPVFGIPPKSGTVYLTTADANGMMVSYIQSNYDGFGSGLVVPGTGISLQNRGKGFTLEPGHPNQVGGGKRPFHTIIPAFVTRNNQPLMSFGVMGGHMQCQGHVQMIQRIFTEGLNPQAASDAPRWQVTEQGTILLEAGYSPAIREALAARGHTLAATTADTPFEMGGAQLILKTNHGYIGGSDHRKDGIALGY